MQVPLEQIKVKRRIRKDMGNLTALAESMKLHGQIHPILITKKYILISGRRRLEAAKLLGWRTINAHIVDAQDEAEKLELELEENLQRLNLTNDEIQNARDRIYKLRNPGFFRRIWNAIAGFFIRLFHIE
mgnify:CR=1 FL=1|jgi:ParB family chromosome partitioning protein